MSQFPSVSRQVLSILMGTYGGGRGGGALSPESSPQGGGGGGEQADGGAYERNDPVERAMV